LFAETPDQMVRRVCRELGNKKNIVVLNDEAHHCYRRKPDGEEEKLSGDDKKEAQQREEEARIWISGLEAVKRKIGVRAIYDVSATPFFLRGSGYPEGTLLPWVVSDFSLIDAIEAGIVKVPRVPVDDDQMRGNQPTYRDLWLRIRNELPKKGRKKAAISGEPKLPAVLEGALQSLEDMEEVRAYVKNDRYVGFKIPYAINGEEKNYEPDFITHVDEGHADLLNLIVEVSRRADAKEREEAKKTKVATARNFWIPAVNNDGRFGRWAFIEITDPWNVKTEIRSLLSSLKG
jgi:hypothetical protein